ncbi:MAG: cation:proton antiporter [Halobacteriaceae archaeon]
MVGGVEAELISLITVFAVAAGVGVVVAKVGRFPYTIALLLAGLAVSVLGIDIDIVLTHDLILLVLLPPLLFEGAATTDLERFRDNLLPTVALAVVGLIVSVALLGAVGSRLLDLPLLVALVFAAMILPTDPVSVLALFEELGAPDRLSMLVEGESLINDGVGVVLFSALLAVVAESGTDPATLLATQRLVAVGTDIVVSSLGGLVVGTAAGYGVYGVMVNLDEHMTEIVLTLLLAYGSFLVAEHYLGVSGVIATVGAGLFIGNRGAEYAMSPQTKISVFNTWDTAAFLVNTLVFVLIGAKTPIDQLLAHARLIAVAIPLVLAARAVVVYPIVTAVNQQLTRAIPLSYQHVMVWGGLHASIPIALVLGLPPDFPFQTELRAMVFGVAAFSLVVQGLTMSTLLDYLDVVTRSEAEELYELLVGRARAIDAALDTAADLDRRNEVPTAVYEAFTEEYQREKEALDDAISELLTEHPDIRREELLVGERRLLQEEKSAIMDAMRSGVVADDVGERLLEEVNIKLDHVRDGESTVVGEQEGFEEFWRAGANEFGLDGVDRPAADGSSEGTDEA